MLQTSSTCEKSITLAVGLTAEIQIGVKHLGGVLFQGWPDV